MFKRSRRLKNVSNAIKSARVHDVSNGIDAKVFDAKKICTYGMNGQIIVTTFDYTQSLLAVATTSGEIHIYGQKQIEVVFTLKNRTQIKDMRFVKGIYLVAVDDKNNLIVLSLYSKQILTTVFCPNSITCIETDPSLDWMLIGLESGSVLVYDVDRNQMSKLRIENLQKSMFLPKERLSPIVSIQWNPRDIGTILISYEHITVIYSFVDAKVKQHFFYQLEPYAPGGDLSTGIEKKRTPKVIQSLYHPNSLHVLTVHEDNSLVFWDVSSGKLIQARSIFETHVNFPISTSKDDSLKEIPAIFKVAWLCQRNPEYTSLLIATKATNNLGSPQELTMIDLGGTPMYSVTSFDAMSKYYAKPVQQKLFSLAGKAPLVNFLPLPKASPFFGGCHDTNLILLLLEDGELETLIYPTGSFSSKASIFPRSLAWVRPTVTTCMAKSVQKKLWLGVMTIAQSDSFLKGGVSASRSIRNHETRSALLTGHSNGSVKIWDASHSEITENAVFEVNTAKILNRGTDLAIRNISFAPETLELAVSSETGDVVLFKFETNKFYNHHPSNGALELKFSRFSLDDSSSILVDVTDRSPSNVKQGFMPSTVIHAKKGTVSTILNSDIGFVAIGYNEGTLVLLDRRGPAIIFSENIRVLSKAGSSYVSAIHCSVMEYGNDGYSSILMLCGTNIGELLTFKILPAAGGTFGVKYADSTKTNNQGRILKIDSFAKESGYSCSATMTKMQDLSKGIPINGFVTVTGETDIRLVSPGKSKDTHALLKCPIASSGLSFIPIINGKGERRLSTIMIALLVNGDVRIMTVPELKEIKNLRCTIPVITQYIENSSVLENGDIVIRNGKFQASLISVINESAAGTNQNSDISQPNPIDTLYNPDLRISYRPQVNSLQWARGTVYCTPHQLDELLGGTERPESKYEESAIAQGTVSSSRSNTTGKSFAGSSEHMYTRPVRNGTRSGGYGLLKSVSRAVETRLDMVETTINDYATTMGQTMNDAMEETGKDMMKSAVGF
ncbi:Sro77p [Saccharomyces cerevisiae x Saccharomyces kudriavzevii VIN7]|uniref:Sro77p n=1 Tax=Saccharomyces cerevisiae x Saccharomyces kudriavzevii (strain VIN7) TaxID=1095631 RepID=H0GQX8_SACCK|nr:Sro77p [Saccharomyces cerevisiae x Saccharomyces kudriavzevii VIN7]